VPALAGIGSGGAIYRCERLKKIIAGKFV
jgi:hypothetical protein